MEGAGQPDLSLSPSLPEQVNVHKEALLKRKTDRQTTNLQIFSFIN